MKHKKGALLFAPAMLILMVIGLLYAYSEISARYKEFNKEIGEKQFELINTYNEGEKALFYIDQSAKYSAYQGIYDLAKNGGCIAGDMYSEYRLWSVDSPTPGTCFPSAQDSKNGFFDFFSNVFNNYLSSYNALNLPQNNYELSFDGTIFVGIAKEPLKLPIIEDKSNENLGTYSIKAPFKVDIKDYDFTDYEALRLKSQEYIEACNNRVPLMCVNEEKPEIFKDVQFELQCPGNAPKSVFLDYSWDADVRYSIYGFCVSKTAEPLIYAYDSKDDSIGYKNLVYKFALPFQDLECTSEGHPELVNTKCMEVSCGDYASCQDATPLCYCAEGKNSCQGACLPFCSEYTGLGVPSELGQPDANGIYKYTAPGATPIWYKHIGNGNWQWTPYDPYASLKCWMPVTTITVSNSCGGKWDGKKPVKANIDIINYLNENKPIPTTSNLIIDSDDKTACTEYQCNSYLSCSSASSCGCSPAANACTGTNCQTLHCDRDGQFEIKEGIKTACKDQCSKYGDCSVTSLCACDSIHLDACQGSCYCNPKEWENTGSCGDKREDNVQCEWNEIPQKREYDPSTCISTDYRCEAQSLEVCPCIPETSCVDLGCGQTDGCGEYCGDCVPEPQPVPTPTPPADDSCEGRCGNQAPDGCWCDSLCSEPEYNDCCGDISEWCS